MINNETGVYLQILTTNDCYQLPFKDIEQLDLFTVQFVDEKDLIKKVFGRHANLITDISIQYSFKSNGIIKTHKLPIKYLNDNFDPKQLKVVFHQHLENNPQDRYKEEWQIKYAITNGRNKLTVPNNTKNISAKELAAAIDSVWGKGYKTRRDIYFALKNLRRYKIEILPTLSFDDRQPSIASQISQINPQNRYTEYLQSYAKLGDEERALAMEQLSMFDLDDLLIMEAPMDGAKSTEAIDTLVEHIEKLSKAKRTILADEICRLRNSFSKTNGKKKCRK